MQANQQLAFIQEKIHEIGSAIFFNLSDAILKFPTSIVKTMKVDDYGFIWFFVQKPKQELKEFETEFPVRLDFYRKGKSYFLQVSGKAWVVNDPEEMNHFVSEELKELALNEELVLIKVKMLKAEYNETATRQNNNWWQSTVNMFTAWFRPNNGYGSNTYFPAS